MGTRGWRRPTFNVWLFGEPATGGSVLRDGLTYIVHGWRDWGIESMGHAGLATLAEAQQAVERWLNSRPAKRGKANRP